MLTEQLLFNELESACPGIHETRLGALLDVAQALQRSQNLSLSEMGKNLSGKALLKHKIKKVDRLEGNRHLHQELAQLYEGLSNFIFKYLSHDNAIPIIVDLCFVKDDRAIQMLSAEIASKGRSIPIYREIFSEGELAERAERFLSRLQNCLPSNKTVIIIMDAGFYEKWFNAIESHGWYWVSRTRTGKDIKLSTETDWVSVKDFISTIETKTKSYNTALLTKKHQHPCRIITTRRSPAGRKRKLRRGKPTGRVGSNCYRDAANEPWILATNLPQTYKATQIILYYSKRMQIEESFRDIKSHQFGLSGRYIRTTCIYRWGVKMLLAAIAQITCWVIGVIGHSQGLQKRYQSNTIRDRKIFSYFTLGQLIINHDDLTCINYDESDLSTIIQKELSRTW